MGSSLSISQIFSKRPKQPGAKGVLALTPNCSSIFSPMFHSSLSHSHDCKYQLTLLLSSPSPSHIPDWPHRSPTPRRGPGVKTPPHHGSGHSMDQAFVGQHGGHCYGSPTDLATLLPQEPQLAKRGKKRQSPGRERHRPHLLTPASSRTTTSGS